MIAKNPILEELHAVRERLLEKAGGSLDALVDQPQAEERKSKRPRYRSRRDTQKTEAAKPDDLAIENQSTTSAER